MTVTQGGTRTRDLANGLPCSNQLSYRVTQQLSGRVRVLKAELPGIQPKRIPSWRIRWGGCGERAMQCTGWGRSHGSLFSASLTSLQASVTSGYSP